MKVLFPSESRLLSRKAIAHSAPDSAIIHIHQGMVVLPHGACQVGMDRLAPMPTPLPCWSMCNKVT